MKALFDLKQDRSFKGFVMILLGTVVTMLAAVTLSGGNASADNGVGSNIAKAHVVQVSQNQGVDTAGLVLFDGSSLKGALK